MDRMLDDERTAAQECSCGECLECGERLSLMRVLLHSGSCLCSHCEARRRVETAVMHPANGMPRPV